MFKTRKGLLLIIIIFLMTGGFASLKDWFDFTAHNGDVRISEQRQTHILHGDKTGGGHKFGTGKACKSEFPKEWNNEEIIETIQTMAANDNVDWKKQKNGYYVSEQTKDGVKVRVVLDRERDDVVTAYPVNVKRNACPPQPANDNYND